MPGAVAPLVGKDAFQLHALPAHHDENEMGLDYFTHPFQINARGFIHIFGVLFNVADEAGTRAPRRLPAHRLAAPERE